MALKYGYLKARIVSAPQLVPSRKRHEVQYHLHTTLEAAVTGGSTVQWDSAINVGTTDADDLLQYKLVFDFANPMIDTLRAAAEGFTELTGTEALPALDFLRSAVLAGTGPWRPSGVMDGSDSVEPVASLLRLLLNAKAASAPVYIFGRAYTDGSLGIHDVHMNQGSTGAFLNQGNDHNDHNDIWQDGALLVDLGQPEWSGYFPAFLQQEVPTDSLGNPVAGAHPITIADDGSLA